MHLFHVQFVEFEDLAIFAKNADEAEQLVDMYLSSNSAEGTSYHLSLPADFLHMSTAEFYQLKAALAKNLSGVGVYHSEMGWTIQSLWEYPMTTKSAGEHERLPSASSARLSDNSPYQKANDNHSGDIVPNTGTC